MRNLDKIKVSLFDHVRAKCKKHISLNEYCNFVKFGEFKNDILKAREALNLDVKDNVINPSGNLIKDRYKDSKSKLKAVAGSVTTNIGETHAAKSVIGLNGYLVIDLDEDITDDLVDQLKRDKYSTILHRSVSGTGVCIFVQINPKAFKICFNELGEYYKDKYDVIIDPSCKNPNRLRYISFDPDLFINLEAETFKNTKRKEVAVPVIKEFVFLESDFSDIVNQITTRKIAICDSYAEYLQVGFAIANEFGPGGLNYFKAIASCSNGYNDKDCEKQFKKCLRADSSGYGNGITISTIYYYAKQNGIELYSERTKQIVRTTSIVKQNSDNKSFQDAVKAIESKGLELEQEEKTLIETVWDSKINFLKGVTSGDSPMNKLIKYVTETSDMYYDEIKNRIFTEKGKVLSDLDVNDIYIGASTIFDGDFNVQKSDISCILSSSIVRRYNPIAEFFNVDVDAIETGYIDQYAKLLPYNKPEQLKYNTWAIKKWLVGGIHNWTCSVYDKEVCPFVLVLSGDQGNGKSSFIRNVLPKELGDDYFLEERIDGNNKDSKIKMGQHLLLCDEEFGGMATKDVKAFKSLADLRIIDERQAYRANSEIWKRRALLGGTTNERSILKDVTGNRRILPIDTYAGNGSVNYDGVIKFDNKKLLLEAYKLYKTGFDWRIFSKDDMAYLNSTNEQFEESEPFGDVFFKIFSNEKNEEFWSTSHMNTGEIINWFGIHTSMKANKHNVEDMMRKNGNIKKEPVKINGKSVRAYKLYSNISEKP